MKRWLNLKEESSSDNFYWANPSDLVSNCLLWQNPNLDTSGTLKFILAAKEGEAEENQTKKVVVRLMNPLEDKGYRLFTDNFYSSPDLFFTLREHGIQACGTVRPNRKDLPKEIMDHKLPLVKNLPRGGFLFRKKGELIAAKWKDKKPVHLISTVPVGNAMDTAKRKVKENGAWVEKEFQCQAKAYPTSISWRSHDTINWGTVICEEGRQALNTCGCWSQVWRKSISSSGENRKQKSLCCTCSGSPHSVSVRCLWASHVCGTLFPALSHPSVVQIQWSHKNKIKEWNQKIKTTCWMNVPYFLD